MVWKICNPDQEWPALESTNMAHSDRGRAEPVLSHASFTREDVEYKSTHSGGLQCN